MQSSRRGRQVRHLLSSPHCRPAQHGCIPHEAFSDPHVEGAASIFAELSPKVARPPAPSWGRLLPGPSCRGPPLEAGFVGLSGSTDLDMSGCSLFPAKPLVSTMSEHALSEPQATKTSSRVALVFG